MLCTTLASVNTVAMTTISIVYPNLLDIGCMSHTIDYVGDKFLTPVLDEFVTAWVQMFSHVVPSLACCGAIELVSVFACSFRQDGGQDGK